MSAGADVAVAAGAWLVGVLVGYLVGRRGSGRHLHLHVDVDDDDVTPPR